jgi:hypothetical protein
MIEKTQLIHAFICSNWRGRANNRSIRDPLPRSNKHIESPAISTIWKDKKPEKKEINAIGYHFSAVTGVR